MWVVLGIFLSCICLTVASHHDGQKDTIHFYDLPNSVPFNQSITIRVESKPLIHKWDLYLRQDGIDRGTLSNVNLYNQTQNLSITIQNTGNNLMLVAISDQVIIGSSDPFTCIQPPTPEVSRTWTSTTLAVSGTMLSEPNGLGSSASGAAATSDPHPVSAAEQSSNSRIPLIIGLTIGSFVFVVVSLLVFLFIRRRRRLANEAPRHIIFNRELMFERRPETYDDWSLRSIELEKGGMAIETPKVYITKLTMSDRDIQTFGQ